MLFLQREQLTRRKRFGAYSVNDGTGTKQKEFDGTFDGIRRGENGVHKPHANAQRKRQSQDDDRVFLCFVHDISLHSAPYYSISPSPRQADFGRFKKTFMFVTGK